MKPLSFLFNGQLCSGCLACIVACQDQNDFKAGDIALRQVLCRETGGYPAAISYLSIACLHCEDAPCLEACPAGAIFRHAIFAVVDVRRELCIGCRTCESACPVGAPKFVGDGRMIKCDFCVARIENGLEPACVRTCTTGALQFGCIDEVMRRENQKKCTEMMKAFTIQVPSA